MKYCQKELINRSAQVKKSAKSFIDTKGFEEILSMFGTIVYTGSYAYDLMVWNDIDLHVILDSDVKQHEQFSQISSKFLEDGEVKSIKLINFYKRRKPSMPQGMYMGLSYDLEGGSSWKVDIWSLSSENRDKNTQLEKSINNRITDDTKLLVLDWKFRLMGQDVRVPHGASYLLYQGIIFEGLKSDREITNFLKERGVVVK